MKYLKILLFLFLTSCATTNFLSSDVLKKETIYMAKDYLEAQNKYLELTKNRITLDVNNNYSDMELLVFLNEEKQITILSKNVMNSWFDFNFDLRKDNGFKILYKKNSKFRKAIDAIDYSQKQRNMAKAKTFKQLEDLDYINNLELRLRISIANIIISNDPFDDIDSISKELKKIYKTMD